MFSDTVQGKSFAAGEYEIYAKIFVMKSSSTGRRAGMALMVSALDSGLSGPGSSPGGALHCVLGQDTSLSYGVHPGV